MANEFELFRLDSSIPAFTARSYWVGVSSAFDIALDSAVELVASKEDGKLNEAERHEFDGMINVVKKIMTLMDKSRDEHNRAMVEFVDRLEGYVNEMSEDYVTIDDADPDNDGDPEAE